MAAWLYQPARFFEACQARYGDTFAMRLPGHPPRAMLAGRDAIQAVFNGDPSCLHAGKANALVEPIVGSQSVLILDGAAHREQRRLLLAMFSSRKVQEHCDTMRELAEEAIATWPVGRDFELQAEMQAITLRVIMAILFGMDQGPGSRALHALLMELLRHAKSPILLSPALQRDLGALTPWRSFVASSRELDARLRALCEERRRAPRRPDGRERADVLSSLLAARDDDGRPLTDQALRDNLVTLLVAGHETTASALSWTVYHVLSDPGVCARLSAELAEVVGDAPVAFEHLGRLTYLDAVVNESLRVSPVLGHVGRVLNQPWDTGGYHLPAGWLTVPCIYLAHRNPRVFVEPELFRPERFLDERFDGASFFPFGGGARRCIGMGVALHEMKIVLATVLQRTELALPPRYRARVQRRGVVWAPRGGVPVIQRRAPRLRHRGAAF